MTCPKIDAVGKQMALKLEKIDAQDSKHNNELFLRGKGHIKAEICQRVQACCRRRHEIGFILQN
jgi:hypothetical protein